MTRTDSDTWDLASSVGATATMVATGRALASAVVRRHHLAIGPRQHRGHRIRARHSRFRHPPRPREFGGAA